MEIRILDSILHGELKPWKLDTFNKRHYTKLIEVANLNPLDFHHLSDQLNTLLSDFPRLCSELKLDDKRILKENFYRIEHLKYTDVITQFYFLLITKESQRVFNAFLVSAEEWENPVDINFHTKSILKNIRVLASQVNDELKERELENEKTVSEKYILYTLTLLLENLVSLFFDIQEVFKESLKTIETEESFSINYLEGNQITFRLKPTEALIRYRLTKLFNAERYNHEEALLLLELSNKSIFKKQNASIENFIFLRNNEMELDSIEQLSDSETIKACISHLKEAVEEKINKHTLGHQRLMVVNEALESLDFLPNISGGKDSIAAIYFKWLIQQKEMYQENANAVFVCEENAKRKAEKAKAPVTKKDRITTEHQKLYAQQQLAFLGGYNIKNEKIMPDNDYKRLLDYTGYLIEHEKLPLQIIPIPQIGLASNAIRYTYYKIHEYLYGTQTIRQNWIDFLHEVFVQFKNSSKSTTKTKFSEKPKSYDADLKSMSR